ncbi:MAG: response regulator [Ardenticatenaceae bacterium]|nr:response regulator [Ardenticatenaceae bacterium]
MILFGTDHRSSWIACHSLSCIAKSLFIKIKKKWEEILAKGMCAMGERKILVIDDEFPVRYLVEHQLKRRGFDVMSAKDGPSGLEVAFAYKPDLIVLDIMMPKMDGFEVCEEIRENPDTARTPVIFLTACVTKEHKLQAFKAGADDYLMKPFQADELEAHIAAVLRRNHAAPEKGAPAPSKRARITSLFSPKGGVGTTTLAIQLAEAVALHEDQSVMLMDLDLPLGGIAPALSLYTNRHIIDLLNEPEEEIDIDRVKRFSQRHRASLWVTPAPGVLVESSRMPNPARLERALDVIAESGHQVILDLGSNLNKLTLAALRKSDVVYMVTSGQPVANKLHNAFLGSAKQLGLEPQRLLPVINELHGNVSNGVDLNRVPVARIPHANEQSRTRLWLRDQGIQKLVSVMI